MAMGPTIMGRRLAMFASGTPAGRAEFAEALREKAVLGGMMMNPLMWNPAGVAAVRGYALGKMAANYGRLAGRRGPERGAMYGAGIRG
jgi:hypothetical protein